MKRIHPAAQSTAVSLGLAAALFLLPLALVEPFPREAAVREEPGTALPSAVSPESDTDGGTDAEVLLRVLDGDTVLEMDLGTYLTGVVRAEMPASFAAEALKAQAVAARTYTLYQLTAGSRHGDTADLCTDHTCCQAWIDAETARSGWGEQADRYEDAVEQAVRATDGEVVFYDGAPILAVFHSSSAGQTRAAGDVWRSDLPYLRPVVSPENAETVPNYYSRVEFSAEEFRQIILAARPEAKLSGAPSGWLRNAVTDDSGSVRTVEVGGVDLRGTEVRALLGLRSACFTWQEEGDRLIFSVTGYGHGVGLSQYGAEVMAETGADYREILTHYYTGAVVDRWQG